MHQGLQSLRAQHGIHIKAEHGDIDREDRNFQLGLCQVECFVNSNMRLEVHMSRCKAGRHVKEAEHQLPEGEVE